MFDKRFPFRWLTSLHTSHRLPHQWLPIILCPISLVSHLIGPHLIGSPISTHASLIPLVPHFVGPLTHQASHLWTKFELFFLIYEAMVAKKWVWFTFGCKVGQIDQIAMKLKLNMSCHLLNIYIPIFKLIAQGRNVRKTQTDGQTDIAMA